jgi:hypothetical protein
MLVWRLLGLTHLYEYFAKSLFDQSPAELLHNDVPFELCFSHFIFIWMSKPFAGRKPSLKFDQGVDEQITLVSM